MPRPLPQLPDTGLPRFDTLASICRARWISLKTLRRCPSVVALEGPERKVHLPVGMIVIPRSRAARVIVFAPTFIP